MDNITSDMLTVLGLAISLVGACITARAVILKDNDAVNGGLSRISGETNEENLRLPMVQNLLASSRGARRGLLLIAGGTLLQIIPIAFRLFSLAL